jgi:hypothetical protein
MIFVFYKIISGYQNVRKSFLGLRFGTASIAYFLTGFLGAS